MAKAETKNEVAVPQNTGMTVAPDFMSDMKDQMGFEGATADAYAVPFLQILQKMSPLVDEDSPKHVAGAKAGMIYNTVTQKLIDGKTGILIVPCAFKRTYIRWGSREGDGGFKGEVAPDDFDRMVREGQIRLVDNKPLHVENGEVNAKKSDYYADTRVHYVLTYDPETQEVGQAILSLSSSQIRASRGLMTTLQQRKVMVNGVPRTPPTFANLVRFTTVGLSNDKGSWSGAKFEIDSLITDPNLFHEAKEFYSRVNSGDVKADHSKSAPTTGDDEEVSGEAKSADTF